MTNVRDHSWIVGLNHGAHDSSAAILRDGKLFAAVEQERLSRRKRAIDEAPVDALRWCLEEAKIELSEVSAVGLGSDLDVLAEWLGLSNEERKRELPFDDPDRLFPQSVFGNGSRPPLIPVSHHLAHAASTFWPSGFDEAAILVVDNRGENTSTTLATASLDGIEVLQSYPIDNSLGLFFRIATQYAGLYSKDGNAGKLMGLASFGSPIYDVGLQLGQMGPEWVGVPSTTTSGKGLPAERTKQLLEFFESRCYPYTIGLREDVFSYIDFAASAQHALEETILGLTRELYERTRIPRLCVAGGVGLNCTANGRIVKESPFREVFFQPMAGDAGVSLGAAYFVARNPRQGTAVSDPLRHAQWGPAASNEEIEDELGIRQLRREKLSDGALVDRVASLIAQGAVVAWHQGRSEIGPRALGGRSLLADPRHRSSLVRLNTIKEREMWRPLAPSVRLRDFHTYFEGHPNPFMIVAAKVRPEWRKELAAIVHIDGSARPQAVDAGDLPLFSSLLDAFESRTGLPILVNTSLNTAGVPISNSVSDSLSIYSSTDVDFMAIGSFLVTRN
jgi:carbamoyltransferase